MRILLALVLTASFSGLAGPVSAQKLDPNKVKAAAEAAKNDAKDELWKALKAGKAIALMRHAIAPGTGDPAEFELGNCKTQRNLSEEGRKQAKAIGDIFRARGISSATVYSSAWCRTRDTAALLDLGKVQTFPPLNSFFANPKAKPFQTRKLKLFVLRARGDTPKVLVTHQVNITALTGKFAKSGEIIVVQPTKDKKIKVLGAL